VSFVAASRRGKHVGRRTRVSLVIVAGSALLLASRPSICTFGLTLQVQGDDRPLFFAQGVAGVLLSLAIALVRRVLGRRARSSVRGRHDRGVARIGSHGPIRLQILHKRTVGHDNRRHRSGLPRWCSSSAAASR